MKNNVLIASIFNIVHFHFLAAVFCDLLYYFFIIINVFIFFCTRDFEADRDPAKMVPWIVRDVVGASNQSFVASGTLIQIHFHLRPDHVLPPPQF